MTASLGGPLADGAGSAGGDRVPSRRRKWLPLAEAASTTEWGEEGKEEVGGPL